MWLLTSVHLRKVVLKTLWMNSAWSSRNHILLQMQLSIYNGWKYYRSTIFAIRINDFRFGEQYLASCDQSIPVSFELIFPSVRNIVPLDINVIISIWSWVLVVESHGVHHFVLDMSNQMSTASNEYWLGQWKWPIHPPDPRKTYPCVQKLNVHWLK